MQSKHIFEGGNLRNLFFIEIDSNELDALPSRHHIFNNSVFGKSQYIVELVVALIESTLKIYLRTSQTVSFIKIIDFIFLQEVNIFLFFSKKKKLFSIGYCHWWAIAQLYFRVNAIKVLQIVCKNLVLIYIFYIAVFRKQLISEINGVCTISFLYQKEW